jgi:type II secretory pathway pseudopilin PulG
MRGPGHFAASARGFALWQLAIVLAVLGALLVAAVSALQGYQTRLREQERSAILSAADEALAAFMLSYHRLPCPDTTGSGVENCAALDQKGWLPVATLGLDASLPARGVQRIKYVVYRSSAIDLAAAQERFNPARWGSYFTAEPDKTFALNQTGTPDLCSGLRQASLRAPDPALAFVEGDGGARANVAYALAQAGTLQQEGVGRFDPEINGNDALHGLSSPNRPADTGYGDRVLARSFASLYGTLNCMPLTRSLDAMGQVTEVMAEVGSQQVANRNSAAVSSAIAAVVATVAGIKVYSATGKFAAASTVLAYAAPLLAVNTALCAAVITAPVGCPLAAIYGTAVGLATAGQVTASVAIGLNTAALALQLAVSVQAGLIATRAQGAITSTEPLSLDAIRAQLKDAWDAAVVKAAADTAAASAARAAADGSGQAYDDAVAALKAAAARYGAGAPDAALATYESYAAARQTHYDTEGKVTAMQHRVNATGDSIATATADHAKAAAIVPQTAEGIIAATGRAAAAAAEAKRLADAALAADPSNASLATAAGTAAIANAGAQADAAGALDSPNSIVSNKLALVTQEKGELATLEAELATLKTTLSQQAAERDRLGALYELQKRQSVGDNVYDTYPFMCNVVWLFDCTGNKYEVVTAFARARTDYDGKSSKETEAQKLAIAAIESARSVEAAKSAYQELASMVDPAPGSATAIGLVGGAEAILKAADAKGGAQ